MSRSLKLKDYIEKISKQDKELLNRLDKSSYSECECGKIMCPKCSEVGR